MTPNETELTLWEHFEELRIRFIRCIVYLCLGTIVGFFLARHVLYVLTRPLSISSYQKNEEPLRLLADKDGRIYLPKADQASGEKRISQFQMEIEFDTTGTKKIKFGPDYRFNFYYFNPIDPFILWFKAALIVGFILSLPFIFFEIWKFVTPGLKAKEKKAVKPIIFAGAILFPVGMAFAYIMLAFALGFFSSYSFPGLEPRLGIMPYLNLALTMMLASGCVFELPVIIVVLSWMGIVRAAFLRKYRRHAIILLFIFAAIITPPDVFTMFMVALPLLFLYEISIIISAIIEKRKTQESSSPEEEES